MKFETFLVIAGYVILEIQAQNVGDAKCEADCNKAQQKCENDNVGKWAWSREPCNTKRITCHGECIVKGCIKKTGLSGYHEKCGCHGECINSHCEKGYCCIPKGYGTNDTNECCSRKGHHVPINTGTNYRCD